MKMSKKNGFRIWYVEYFLAILITDCTNHKINNSLFLYFEKGL